MIYYLCHNKMSGQVSAVRHFVMRLIQSQRFKLNAIVNKPEEHFSQQSVCLFQSSIVRVLPLVARRSVGD